MVSVINNVETKKPKVVFVSDVKNWAWYFKSLELKKYLSDEFDIDIVCVLAGEKITKKYDIYFTFGYSYIDIDALKKIPREKKITGVTAHRPIDIIASKMNQAYAVHANSRLLMDLLYQVHDNVYYLPNGVDENLFEYMPMLAREDNITIGHVGKLSPLKGQHKFIEPAVQKAKCLYYPHYNNHTEMLPHEAMPGSVYKQIDALIVASEEDGTPNSALEAAACGRPIISNMIGNMPEFIENGVNGFLVAKDIDSYAKKIIYLRKNRQECKEMGLAARKTVEEGWTWKIQAENYRKMFRDVIAGKESNDYIDFDKLQKINDNLRKNNDLVIETESIIKTEEKRIVALAKKATDIAEAKRNGTFGKEKVDVVKKRKRTPKITIDKEIEARIKKSEEKSKADRIKNKKEQSKRKTEEAKARKKRMQPLMKKKPPVAKKPLPVKVEKKKIEKVKKIIKKHTKPSVLLLVDVIGWAWDEKAQNIKKYLSDEFDVDIRYFQASTNKFDRRKKYDIYFTFECGSARFINHANKNRRITGVTSHTFTSMPNFHNKLKSCDILHANSILLKEELQTYFPKKHIYYLPNGVNEEKFSLNNRKIEKPFTVCYVGKNTKRKGYSDYIVPACEKAGVILKGQTCRFNSPNVIKHKDMPNFYKGVDVVLVASDMDGTPNPLLEAASRGITFISNKIGNVPEFVENGVNGFLVDRKIKDYVDKLNWLKDHRQECKEMGLDARKTVEEGWTWKIQAENYRKMFREVLNK